MEQSRVSRRQLGAWGAGVASVLVTAPGRATADVLAAPTSAADIVPASLTIDKYEAMAEKLRADIASRKPSVRMQGGGGDQWTLMRQAFRGKWTGPTTWFGKVYLYLCLFGPHQVGEPELFSAPSVRDL